MEKREYVYEEAEPPIEPLVEEAAGQSSEEYQEGIETQLAEVQSKLDAILAALNIGEEQ